MFFFISPNWEQNASVLHLADLANRRGYKVTYPQEFWTRSYAFGECGIVLGEQPFCEFVAQEMNWILHQNSVEYLDGMPFTILKRAVRLETLDEVRRKDEKSAVTYKRIFRPADDDKVFPEGIYNNPPADAPGDTLVYHWIYQNWDHKYRFLVVDNRVIDCYKYKNFDIIDTPGIASLLTDVKDFTKRTAQDYLESILINHRMAPACIVDIAFREDQWSLYDTRPVFSTKPGYFQPDRYLTALTRAVKLVRYGF